MQKITADVFFRRAAATRLSIPTKRMLNPPEGADGEPRRVREGEGTMTCRHSAAGAAPEQPLKPGTFRRPRPHLWRHLLGCPLQRLELRIVRFHFPFTPAVWSHKVSQDQIASKRTGEGVVGFADIADHRRCLPIA